MKNEDDEINEIDEMLNSEVEEEEFTEPEIIYPRDECINCLEQYSNWAGCRDASLEGLGGGQWYSSGQVAPCAHPAYALETERPEYWEGEWSAHEHTMNTAEDVIYWISEDVKSGYVDSVKADSYIDNLEQMIKELE